MARDDWFRNTEWSSAIEEAFFAKLKRARDKPQYLRIQACTLANRHPHIALRLLEQYFNLGEHFDHAQGYVDRATALLALGNAEEALKSYEAALATEERRPNMKTQAYLNLPFTVAAYGIKGRYEQALHILAENQSRLTFPVDHFLWHAARSLIQAELGHTSEAQVHALRALEAARKEHSGFRYHPTVGLVGDSYESIRTKIEKIAVQPSPPPDAPAAASRRQGRG